MQLRIERFFDYKWQNDKNATFYAKEHKDLVIQLPEYTIDKLYYMCLFNNFLDYYGKVFEVPKNYSSSVIKIQHARYTWADN